LTAKQNCQSKAPHSHMISSLAEEYKECQDRLTL